MEYQVLHGRGLMEITNLVNKAMAEGWKPLGGISIYMAEEQVNEYQAYAFQAMTREIKSTGPDILNI